jgi:RNA polymerase sigma-70 factor (ECF subfamily)
MAPALPSKRPPWNRLRRSAQDVPAPKSVSYNESHRPTKIEVTFAARRSLMHQPPHPPGSSSSDSNEAGRQAHESGDERHRLADVPESSTDTDLSRHAYVTLLFNKYRASILRHLSRLVPHEDAAELAQETYYRLLRHPEIVPIEGMARALLFQTAANLARDYRRRRLSHRSDQHVQLTDDELAQEHMGPEAYLTEQQVRAVLEQAIAEMPHDTRTVFLLHRFRDLSYPQIAQVTRLSARTVARKMAEALAHLSAALGQTT